MNLSPLTLALVARQFGALSPVCCCAVPIVLFSLCILAFHIWVIVDCVTKEPTASSDKIVWLLIILFVPFGSLIYFFFRRPKRKAQFGR